MSFNEWERKPLKDIIKFNPRESIKKGKECKKIGMSELNPFEKKIQGYEISEYKSGTKFRNGDTLFARITPCLENGKTAKVDILDEDEVGFGSTEFIVMRKKDGLSDEDFVYYLAISPFFRNMAIKTMTGTSGRQRAQIDVIKKTVLEIPELKEQKAIAKILSTLDEKIETNNKINKTLEEMAQAIFKHWFVDFEFPNEEGQPYKSSGGKMIESELGMIPEVWKVKELEEITKVNRRGFSPKYADEGIKVINQRCIRDNNIKDEAIKYHDLDKKKVPEEVYLKSKDILINSMGVGTLGRVSQRTIINEQSIIHSCISIIRANEDIINSYILGRYFMNIQNELERMGTGSTGQTSLKNKLLAKKKFIVPSMEIQNNIINKFEKISIKIDMNTLENQTLANIRDILLPKLMSGEIRVPLDEEEIEKTVSQA